jgi:hypothetical protein
LQRAELKLLHGSFRAAESGRHLADCFLVDKPQPNHLLLDVGQALDVPIEGEPALDVLELARIRRIGT